MEPVTLLVANDLAALPVLQAASTALVRAVDDSSGDAREIELVIEELFTNILKYEYLPGQRESIRVSFEIKDQVFDLKMRFKGVPFDVEYLQRCGYRAPGDPADDEGRGLGLELIRHFSDQLQYRNLGKEGQEIHLCRKLSACNDRVLPSLVDTDVSERPSAALRVIVRRMLPHEAAAVSRLAYFAFRYSYDYVEIYTPERVRQLNENNQLLSFVAVNDEDNCILGHGALKPDALSSMYEACIAFVDPRYRGKRIHSKIALHLLVELEKSEVSGLCVFAATSHPYSQKSASLMGLRETALFLSCVSPAELVDIREETQGRESLLFMAGRFTQKEWGPFYPPACHAEMVGWICRHLKMNVVLHDDVAESPLPPRGQLKQVTDSHKVGHLFVHHYANDTVSQVGRTLRKWRLDRLETVYLYLPLLQPPTAWLCCSFEEMGFFFAGLRPGFQGELWLVLQFLNNQRCNYDRLKAATSFGQALIEYVRKCDPVQEENETCKERSNG